MSVSSAKRRANRLNAQKSTGPVTAEGKAASSRNAITHGIFCKDLLILNESEAELGQLKQAVMQRMRPRDAVELQLAEQWVGSCWKLKRLQSAETCAFEDLARSIRRRNDIELKANGKSPKDLSEPDAAHVTRRLLEDSVLDKYQRYQQRLFSTMLRCSRELRILQEDEIDEDQDVNVQNEATDPTDVDVQNEANEPSEVNAQNEANDASAECKPSLEHCLPAALNQPIQPRVARMMAAVESALHPEMDVKLKNVV